MSPIALCPRCGHIARRIDAATVQCNEHGTIARRTCCSSWLGDVHESGCPVPHRATLAEARIECRLGALLHDDESQPLDAPRGLVSLSAIEAAKALRGAYTRLRAAEGTPEWAERHAHLRGLALVLVEELRACQSEGRAAA